MICHDFKVVLNGELFEQNLCVVVTKSQKSRQKLTRETKEEWVERLRVMLLEKALHEFDRKEVPLELFSNFLKDTAYIPDEDRAFINHVYADYHSKIQAALKGMADKFSDFE